MSTTNSCVDKSLPLTLHDITAAHRRIQPFVHQTPVLSSESLTKMTYHTHLFFKCENLQKTGSFKIRGATNAVLKLQEQAKATGATLTGVVTHSSGNHGQALALAARNAGIDAHVVVPSNAPRVKVQAIEGYNARIYRCRPTQAAREAMCAEVQETVPGVNLVHPYDNLDVMAGQGTLALELHAQLKGQFDAVVVPIGGGGLGAGVATAIKGLDPRIAVIGAEPEQADDFARGFRAGGRVGSHREGCPSTIADGLQAVTSERTFAILKARLDDVVVVSEAAMRSAMFLVYERLKVVIEPSAAVGVAAVLSRPESLSQYQRVAVVLCGGNVEVDRISTLSKI